eukprot:CAMPEP_0182893036 /NCGR_PEP_ID=MMETSP0034_2-20130328/24236_1 /TAXON_ID=156128 /ORGANISM="Nephroselmis pyriformis, Strain CCMP717" /LENGTH=132 /DNA_ID=CAMNT_0025026755 /DNA_START=182 /DNA_END=576 /DNA_ORIENTATION=-
MDPTEEADNDLPEDLTEDALALLLLPSGKLPLNVERFGLVYSKVALQGWVKQPSPCCAASSVAGAWNSMLGAPRGDGRTTEDVIKILQGIVSDQIASKRERLERLVESPVGELEAALRAHAEGAGRLLGGKP